MTVDNAYTVLVVDDDEICREEIHRLLGGFCAVIDAVTGREALDLLRSRRVHCVLLDYRLPEMDGLEVLPKIVQLQMPVIMMTAEGSEQVAVEAMKQGAYDYLIKSTLEDDALQKSVENAINRAALEKKVREQQQELEMFASAASHDLKSPLRTIATCVSFIKEDIETSNTEKLLEHCQNAVSGVEHLNHLIDGLHEYTQSGRSDRPLERVDLRELAVQVVSALQATIADLSAQVDVEDLPEVLGDRVALYQLLQNLVVNGLKFHDGQGTPCVRIAALQVPGHWQISVNDNGIGIAPKHHEKIFKPLKRLHSQDKYEGSGLGLAMCKRVIDQHGGRIWLESELGKGTTFLCTIPIDPSLDRHTGESHAAEAA